MNQHKTPSILVISNFTAFHTVRPEAEIFISLANKGYNIHIMTYGGSEYFEKFQQNNITTIDFHPKNKFDKNEIQYIKDYILQENIDIVHFNNRISALNGLIAVKKLNVKVILYRGYSRSLHWYDPTDYLYFLNSRVDKIICNAKGVKALFDKQLFFKKDKTKVILKGHKTEWYTNTIPYDIRKELNLPEDSFLIVNVANNRKFKGIPYLLKSMIYLAKEKNIHLVLIGNGMDTPKNQKIIDKTKNKSNIHLIGFRKDVLNIVASCNVFVLSSLEGESINKSVIEAMSLSVPAIVTDILTNEESVEHEISGLKVKVKSPKAIAEGVNRLYHDKKLYTKLKQGAVLHIQNNINHEETVNEYMKFYNNL